MAARAELPHKFVGSIRAHFTTLYLTLLNYVKVIADLSFVDDGVPRLEPYSFETIDQPELLILVDAFEELNLVQIV